MPIKHRDPLFDTPTPNNTAAVRAARRKESLQPRPRPFCTELDIAVCFFEASRIPVEGKKRPKS